MKRLATLGLLTLPAACAQILGVGDFTDQAQPTTTGLGGTTAVGMTGVTTGDTTGQATAASTTASDGTTTGGGGSTAAVSTTSGGSGTGGIETSTSGTTVCDADFKCVGSTLFGCESGVETELDQCESAALCDAEAGECVVPACSVGQFQCTGQFLEACAENRTGFVEALDCTTADLCDDDNGRCEVGACTPGEYECNSEVLLQCSEGGTALEFVQTCATAAFCNATAGQCDTPTCVSGEYRCQNNSLQLCNENLDGFVEVDVCATAGLCDAVGSQCRPPVCLSSDHECEGNLLRVCTSERTGFEPKETCAADKLCSSISKACIEPEHILALDGRLVQFPCADGPAADDCVANYVIDGVTTTCQGGALNALYRSPVQGSPGQEYDVTLHFYGILEPKNYGNGVTREASGSPSRDQGGTPTPWASAPGGHSYPNSNYVSYELRVSDENDQEVAAYYLNADSTEGHYTFAINYQKTIRVVGGGEVVFRSNNSNCRIMKNCGSNGGAPCSAKARTIDISSADPAPSGLDQPDLGYGDANHSGQWLLIDVVDVVPR